MTAEERLMYDVMQSVYDSQIPISFKGAMVLKASLLEAGYQNEMRHTADIDANWNTSDAPTADQMVNALQNALDANGVPLRVSLYRMYGEGRSAGFDLKDSSSGEALFTMDIDVNRPVPETKLYEMDNIRFIGAAPYQMMADKIVSISSNKVFRRIKDVVDLYYMSHVFVFDCDKVLTLIQNSERSVGSFNEFLNCQDELAHAYGKFRFTGDVFKPSFHEVYNRVKSFIFDILPL